MDLRRGPRILASSRQEQAALTTRLVQQALEVTTRLGGRLHSLELGALPLA